MREKRLIEKNKKKMEGTSVFQFSPNTNLYITALEALQNGKNSAQGNNIKNLRKKLENFIGQVDQSSKHDLLIQTYLYAFYIASLSFHHHKTVQAGSFIAPKYLEKAYKTLIQCKNKLELKCIEGSSFSVDVIIEEVGKLPSDFKIPHEFIFNEDAKTAMRLFWNTFYISTLTTYDEIKEIINAPSEGSNINFQDILKKFSYWNSFLSPPMKLEIKGHKKSTLKDSARRLGRLVGTISRSLTNIFSPPSSPEVIRSSENIRTITVPVPFIKPDSTTDEFSTLPSGSLDTLARTIPDLGENFVTVTYVSSSSNPVPPPVLSNKDDLSRDPAVTEIQVQSRDLPLLASFYKDKITEICDKYEMELRSRTFQYTYHSRLFMLEFLKNFVKNASDSEIESKGSELLKALKNSMETGKIIIKNHQIADIAIPDKLRSCYKSDKNNNGIFKVSSGLLGWKGMSLFCGKRIGASKFYKEIEEVEEAANALPEIHSLN